MNPEKVQLIQPPITIMGSMLVNIPFIMSNAMLGSVWDKYQSYTVRERHTMLANIPFFTSNAMVGSMWDIHVPV